MANTDEFPKEKSTSPSASEENKVVSILLDTKMKKRINSRGARTKNK